MKIVYEFRNSSSMSYNILDHLQKMKVALPIMGSIKIPQQKENLFKDLEDECPRGKHIEATVMT